MATCDIFCGNRMIYDILSYGYLQIDGIDGRIDGSGERTVCRGMLPI